MDESLVSRKIPAKSASGISIEEKRSTGMLKVGMHIFLEFSHKNQRIKTTASLLGWQEPSFIFITFPRINGRIATVPEKTDVVVRYILDGMVFGFSSKMIHKQHNPISMWILDFPTEIAKKNLRRSPRYRIQLDVGLDNGNVVRTVDISQHGACLAMKGEENIGSTIYLSFTLPNGSEVKRLAAVVVRTHFTREYCQVGVEFDQQDLPQNKLIRDFLNTQINCTATDNY